MVYVFIFLILLGYFLNYISKKYILNKVELKREVSSKTLEEGEEFFILTTIENKKMLPVTFLQLREKFPISMEYNFKADITLSADYIFHTSTMEVMPYQRIKRKYSVKFKERGKYFLRGINITAGDFIGLGTVNKDIDCSDEIIVYPKAFDIDQQLISFGDFMGEISVMRWIIDDPLVTAGIREYTGFEPEKTIHWPSSLKAGKLMVRNFDYTSDNSVFMILNIECFKPAWVGVLKENLEKCFSIVRALADELEERHIKYGFTTNALINSYFNGENYMAPSLGDEHHCGVLESLGSANYEVSLTFEELMSNVLSWRTNCKTYLIVTPVVLPEYVEVLNEASLRADRAIIISTDRKNMDKLNQNIIKYTVETGE